LSAQRRRRKKGQVKEEGRPTEDNLVGKKEKREIHLTAVGGLEQKNK